MSNICKFVIEKCKLYSNKTLFLDSSSTPQTYGNFGLNLLKTIDWLKANRIEATLENFSIISPNCVSYLYFLFALHDARGTAVNLNPQLASVEMGERLNIGKVTVLITTELLYSSMASVLKQTGVRTVLLIDDQSSEFKVPEILKLNPKVTYRKNNDGETAFLQFTGGTTGITKAAVVSHTNVLENVAQLTNHIGAYVSLESLMVLVAFPFYHIFSLVFNFLFFLNNGGTCILYKNLRDTDLITSLFKTHRVNFIVAVNTWYKKLMQNPGFMEIDFSHVRVSLAGGEYVPLSTKKSWKELTGKVLYSAYGLTETSALAIVSPMDETNIEDSLGIAVLGTQVCLLDESNQQINQDLTPGEIALKGPQVACEYYENEEETQKAFVDGWFKTGDIAERVGGKFYRMVDRKKDMISVSGNKVYPNEVEEVISKLYDVSDVGVVGRKSKKSGEEVVACVVLKPGSILTAEEIINHCSVYLSRYKVPKHIYTFAELPKTPIGKTARRVLRDKINKNE